MPGATGAGVEASRVALREHLPSGPLSDGRLASG